MPNVSNSDCFCASVISPTLNRSLILLEAALKKLSTWTKLFMSLFDKSNPILLQSTTKED